MRLRGKFQFPGRFLLRRGLKKLSGRPALSVVFSRFDGKMRRQILVGSWKSRHDRRWCSCGGRGKPYNSGFVTDSTRLSQDRLKIAAPGARGLSDFVLCEVDGMD